MRKTVRLALSALALAVLLPPTAALAKSEPVIPAAGHAQVTLLAPSGGHEPGGKSLQPFHNPHPDALEAAKARADARARAAATTAQTATPPAAAGTVFNGLDNTGLAASDEGNSATPPDSTGAIGPAQYMEMVNNLVGVYDRNTLALIGSTSFATFAHVPSGVGTSDPQIEWDPVANRWLYAMVGIATGNNYLLFGWSKTADPTNLSGGWCTFGVPTGRHLQDYPKLGHDANWVVVGANAYSDVNSSFPFETAQIWAVPKPPTTDTTCSSTVSATFFADAAHPLKNADGTLAFTPVPANTTDSGNDYIVGSRDVSVASASKLMVWHMEARPAPTLVPDGDITVGTYSVPPSVPQPGSSFLIDSLDGRTTQAVARFDSSAGAEALWTQHTIAGSGGPSVVRWYELLPGTLTIRQEGSLSSPTDYYWNAAISPSAAGNDAMIEYNRGSAAQLALIGAQTRSSSTALGQMDPGEINLATSSAPIAENAFQGNCSPNPCRWGDYSGATPDLSNAHVVWGSNQVSGPPFLGFAQWQTQNFAVSTVPPPPDFSLSASPASQTIVPGASTSYTINVARISGFGGSVTLSVTGLPSGVAGSLSPNPVTATTSTLSVTSSSSAAFGTYPLTVTGTSGSLTHSAGATLVLSPPPPCSSASLAPASTTQPVGTAIQFMASSTGCSSPVYEYWVQLLDGSWNMMRAFSSDPTWTWNTAGLSPGTFTVHVWANQAGHPTTTFEAFGSSTVTLTGCATAGLSPASASVPVGSSVGFTATSTGCTSPQYEYWVQYLDASWHMLRAFSTDPTWNFNTAGLPGGVYTVHVWANNSGDSTASFEAFGSSTVTLTGGKCTGAGLTPASPTQSAGSTIQFTASSTGCTSPQYEYWVQYLDASWHNVRPFSTDPTFAWATAGLTPGVYTVEVWANQVGDPTSTWEAFASSKATLTGGCTGASLAPASTTVQVTSTVQFTASSTGCPNPTYEYWVQYLDGTWHMVRAFSSDPTFAWSTAGLGTGTFSVHVWANQAGDSTSTWEAFGASSVTLTGCTSASLTASAGSISSGGSITFTATASGCTSPVFEFWLQDTTGAYHMMQGFSSTTTWTWTTTGWQPGTYHVIVWANQQGADTSTWETFATVTVTVT